MTDNVERLLSVQLEATLVSVTYMLLARTDAVEVVSYIRDMMKRAGLPEIERPLSPNADLTPKRKAGRPRKNQEPQTPATA